MSTTHITPEENRLAWASSREVTGYPQSLLDETKAYSREYTVNTAHKVLLGDYSYDAHVVSYVVYKNGKPLPTQPRLLKGKLPWVREQGFDVRHHFLIVDVDRIGHIPMDEASRQDCISKMQSVPDIGWYTTGGGFRVLKALQHHLTPEQWEHSINVWIPELQAALGDQWFVDPSCDDWTRHFRLPHVYRIHESGKKDTAEYKRWTVDTRQYCKMDLSRMTPVDNLVPDVPMMVAKEPRKITPRAADEGDHPASIALLERACQELASAKPGTRHRTLIKWGYTVGGHVAAGGISFDHAYDRCLQAISHYDGDKDDRKLSDAIENGMGEPTDLSPRYEKVSPEASAALAEEVEFQDSFEYEGVEVPEAPKEKSFQRHLKNDDSPHLAKELLGDLSGSDRDPVVFSLGRIHVYRKGIFQPLSHSELNRHVGKYSLAGSTVGASNRQLRLPNKAIDAAIQNAYHMVDRGDFFDHAPVGIGFANGFLHVDTKSRTLSLIPHSPKNRLLHCFPFDYVEGQKPTKLLGCFDRWFRTKPTKDMHIRCVQQFCGAGLVGLGAKMQKILILRGDGGDGKGRLPLILKSICPTDSTSNVAPQDFNQEYHRASLVGKLFNIVGDLPEGDLLESGPFKAVSTGDRVSARHPKEKVFFFEPKAAQFWMCNTLFKVNDVSNAMKRRPIILDFDAPEKGAVDNPFIAEEIITEESKSVVCWMLDGLRDLLVNGWAIPPESTEAVNEWLGESCTASLFLTANATPLKDTSDHKTWTRGKVLYEEYTRWCQDNGNKPFSSTKFGKRAKQWLKGHGLTHHDDMRGVIYPVVTAAGELTLKREAVNEAAQTQFQQALALDEVLSVETDDDIEAEISRLLAKSSN